MSRNYNTTPFLIDPFPTMFKRDIGFGDMFKELSAFIDSNRKMVDTEACKFPPYDIYTEGDIENEEYRLFFKFALAGIEKQDIKVTYLNGVLEIWNEKNKSADDNEKKRYFIKNGIARREFHFTRSVPADTFDLVKCSFDNGCLLVEFKKKPKEEEQKKFIEIL